MEGTHKHKKEWETKADKKDQILEVKKYLCEKKWSKTNLKKAEVHSETKKVWSVSLHKNSDQDSLPSSTQPNSCTT